MLYWALVFLIVAIIAAIFRLGIFGRKGFQTWTRSVFLNCSQKIFPDLPHVTRLLTTKTTTEEPDESSRFSRYRPYKMGGCIPPLADG